MLLDGEVVDEVAGLEVVGGVQNEVDGRGWGELEREQLGDVAGARSAMWAWTAMVELKRAMWRRAASALGRDSRASASSKRTWRWRLEGSTKSRSMRVRVPTPARASKRCGGGSGGSAADDGDVGGGEALLAGGADAGEEDLARVAVAI